MLRVGILTSSRADYGIYRPLLRALKSDTDFHVDIIAFGTHLAPFYGKTIDTIINDGYEVKYTLNTMVHGDDENATATAVGITSLKFAEFWKEHQSDFDVVFCLGDRYEMFAAVSAGIPFGIRFAHLHGGETTLGAIDNVYRHCITLASTFHFASTHTYAKKVSALTGTTSNVWVVGALSLDNINEVKLMSASEFIKKWNIDLETPFVLITIHPETIRAHMNQQHTEAIKSILEKTLSPKYSLVVTMPNADTAGNVWRQFFLSLAEQHVGRIHLIENFGTQSYFTCLKECQFILGNSSSGIIEAASFGKYVINIGDRQEGRITGTNVLHTKFDFNEIDLAIKKIESFEAFNGPNIYFAGGSANTIINVLKSKLHVH